MPVCSTHTLNLWVSMYARYAFDFEHFSIQSSEDTEVRVDLTDSTVGKMSFFEYENIILKEAISKLILTETNYEI